MHVQGANGFTEGDNPKLVSEGKGFFDPRIKGRISLSLIQLWQLMGIETRVNSGKCVSNHGREKCSRSNMGVVLSLALTLSSSQCLH